MLRDFRAFIDRGNLVQLAVGEIVIPYGRFLAGA